MHRIAERFSRMRVTGHKYYTYIEFGAGKCLISGNVYTLSIGTISRLDFYSIFKVWNDCA